MISYNFQMQGAREILNLKYHLEEGDVSWVTSSHLDQQQHVTLVYSIKKKSFVCQIEIS
jgi:hypothetical protein